MYLETLVITNGNPKQSRKRNQTSQGNDNHRRRRKIVFSHVYARRRTIGKNTRETFHGHVQPRVRTRVERVDHECIDSRNKSGPRILKCSRTHKTKKDTREVNMGIDIVYVDGIHRVIHLDMKYNHHRRGIKSGKIKCCSVSKNAISKVVIARIKGWHYQHECKA